VESHRRRPTTSIREEPYQAQIIKEFGLRGVIARWAWATRRSSLQGIWLRVSARGSGAAQVLAECIKKVRNVYLMEIRRARGHLGI